MRRARTKQLEFTITQSDIVIPELCPVLKIPLFYGDGNACPNSPSIDRIDNTKGYTSDNVAVISHRANWIKGEMTIDDVRHLIKENKKTYTVKGVEIAMSDLKRLFAYMQR